MTRLLSLVASTVPSGEKATEVTNSPWRKRTVPRRRWTPAGSASPWASMRGAGGSAAPARHTGSVIVNVRRAAVQRVRMTHLLDRDCRRVQSVTKVTRVRYAGLRSKVCLENLTNGSACGFDLDL